MLEERLVLPEGHVLEARVLDDLDFVLSLRKGKTLLVEYRMGRCSVGGRTLPYAFKSVEKLRYDFERDADDALRQG